MMKVCHDVKNVCNHIKKEIIVSKGMEVWKVHQDMTYIYTPKKS